MPRPQSNIIRQYPAWLRYMFYGGLRTSFTLILHLAFRFRADGQEHLPNQPVLLAGNHTGYLDSLMMMAATTQPVWFLMGADIFRWPILGLLFHLIPNKIVVDPAQPRQAIRLTVDALKQGRTVCIFPEGKLTVDGQLNPFQPGVAVMQQLSQVPIVPFTLNGGFQAWGWKQTLPRLKQPLSVVFHSSLPFDAATSREGVIEQLLAAVTSGFEPRSFTVFHEGKAP